MTAGLLLRHRSSSIFPSVLRRSPRAGDEDGKVRTCWRRIQSRLARSFGIRLRIFLLLVLAFLWVFGAGWLLRHRVLDPPPRTFPQQPSRLVVDTLSEEEYTLDPNHPRQHYVQAPSIQWDRSSILTGEPESLNYFAVWTTDASSFQDRHRLALELLFRHEPNARLWLVTSTLSPQHLRPLLQRGYRIDILPLTRQFLLQGRWYVGSHTKRWLEEWDRWERDAPWFRMHLTDYLRFVLLYHLGGTYMDMDALWIHKPPVQSVHLARDGEPPSSPRRRTSDQQVLQPFNYIGTDIVDVPGDEAWSFPVPTAQQDSLLLRHASRHRARPILGLYLPPGVMRFRKGTEALREAAEQAFGDYQAACFNCCGPRAITAYYRDRHPELLTLPSNDGTDRRDFVLALPTHVLYPVSWNEAGATLFQPRHQQDAWQLVQRWYRQGTWNIHLFGHATKTETVAPGSLIRALSEYFGMSTRGNDAVLELVAPQEYELARGRGSFQGLDLVFVRASLELVLSGDASNMELRWKTRNGFVTLDGAVTLEMAKEGSITLAKSSFAEWNQLLARIRYIAGEHRDNEDTLWLQLCISSIPSTCAEATVKILL